MIRWQHWGAIALIVGMTSGMGMMPARGIDAGPERLSQDDLAVLQPQIPQWQQTGETLSRTYLFENFVEAVAFVNQLVEPAEALGHHPDVAIAYNRVTLTLTTHDAGGLTQLDVALAILCDQRYAAISSEAPPVFSLPPASETPNTMPSGEIR